MHYNGYTAVIQYSEEDKIFWGKLAMINDAVTFEAENVADLEKNFHEAVEDYIETCTKIGKKPEKEFKGVFNVRISPELHQYLYMKSIEKGVSLNKVIQEDLAKLAKIEDKEDAQKSKSDSMRVRVRSMKSTRGKRSGSRIIAKK